MRVIFYAEPKDNKQVPKQVPDKESIEARWVTLNEFEKLNKIRGEELLVWGAYIENGGQVFPCGVFADENSQTPQPINNKAFTLHKKDIDEEMKQGEVNASDLWDKIVKYIIENNEKGLH